VAPRRRPNRRAWFVVLGVGAGILAAVGALTAGSFVFGSFSSVPPQSAAGGIPNAPPGVWFVIAQAQMVNASTIPATGACTASNLGNISSPVLLSSGNTSGLCANHVPGGFATGDMMFTMEIGWNATALNATIFKVQVSFAVTPSANDVAVTSYVKTSVRITSPEMAVYALDITQAGDTSVTSFSALVTQL